MSILGSHLAQPYQSDICSFFPCPLDTPLIYHSLFLINVIEVQMWLRLAVNCSSYSALNLPIFLISGLLSYLLHHVTYFMWGCTEPFTIQFLPHLLSQHPYLRGSNRTAYNYKFYHPQFCTASHHLHSLAAFS